jgi:hypothetical protein
MPGASLNIERAKLPAPTKAVDSFPDRKGHLPESPATEALETKKENSRRRWVHMSLNGHIAAICLPSQTMCKVTTQAKMKRQRKVFVIKLLNLNPTDSYSVVTAVSDRPSCKSTPNI